MKKVSLLMLIFLSLSTIALGQTFVIDQGHTFITLSVNRFGAVDVMGRFNSFDGELQYDQGTNLVTSANISIKVQSFDSGHDVRDGHIIGPFWLDAENYPTIQFSTNDIKKNDLGYIAVGDLTIHGVTQKIELPFQMVPPNVDPTGKKTIGIQSAITINRQDFAISMSKKMDNGQFFIGNEVHIVINALAAE